MGEPSLLERPGNQWFPWCGDDAMNRTENDRNFRMMSRFRVGVLSWCAVLLCTALQLHHPADGCTTAVISGKATADGRPILWKNRDTSSRHNEVVLLTDGKHRVVAVVNAGKRN